MSIGEWAALYSSLGNLSTKILLQIHFLVVVVHWTAEGRSRGQHIAKNFHTDRLQCGRARIPHGQPVSGGIIWHDLRRTFATRLRALEIHEYDIKDLLGPTIAGVTSTYARLTPDVLKHAVERLAEQRARLLSLSAR